MPTIVSPNLYFAEGESILAVMERIGKVPNLEKITMNKEGETLPLNTVNTYPARRFFKKVLKQDLTVRAVEGQARKVAVKRHFRQTKDPNLTALEEQLQAALGTKVTIKKSGETGSIIIEFYSAEELSDLMGKLGS